MQRWWLILVVLAGLPAWVRAGEPVNDPNLCDALGEAPDVIVGDLTDTLRYGAQNGITAFAVGTTSCNVGTCRLNWIAGNSDHPVIGQNMFRLKEGRFEQVGQAWLKHGFGAFQLGVCSNQCHPTDFQHLGVNCADPYFAGLNGSQNGLGPKFEVDPSSGVFPYPATDLNETGDTLYKRLQVFDFELHPALNPGARYFVEGQYVTRDDAAAGNNANNASYREIDVLIAPQVLDIQLIGETQREQAGIQAWQDVDGSVIEATADVDGRFFVSSKVTLLPSGLWHYEYAVQNLTSHRGANAFTVPVPPGVVTTSVSFRSARYHSGSPYEQGLFTIGWATSGSLTWSHNPADNNPLLWGTLYNFRFDADAAPDYGEVTLGLYRPGQPATASTTALIPSLTPACDADGFCDPGEDCSTCMTDCAPTAEMIYEVPQEIENLRWPDDRETLEWDPYQSEIGASIVYDLLRGDLSELPVGSGPSENCVGQGVGAPTALDDSLPVSGRGFFYVVRGRTSCGAGTLGYESRSEERISACP